MMPNARSSIGILAQWISSMRWVQYGCFFTIGVEVHFSDHIKSIATAVPDHLLLTETDNPGGLKWLNGELGMPTAIENVVKAVAELQFNAGGDRIVGAREFLAAYR